MEMDARQTTDGEFLTPATNWVDGLGFEQDGDYNQLSYTTLWHHRVAGDTLIDGRHYYRMERQEYGTIVHHDEATGKETGELRKSNDKTHYFMREDEAGDVWMRVDDKETFTRLSGNRLYEAIADKMVDKDLFLFNAKKEYEVGDKLMLGGSVLQGVDSDIDWEGDMWRIRPTEVTKVEEEAMEDGLVHKVYNMAFISGVGPLYGPLGGLGGPDNYEQKIFLTFYQDDAPVYKNQGYVAALETIFPNILNIVTGKQNPDGINRIPGDTDGSCYDLQGRKLQAIPAHGLYIQNGHKVAK